MKLAMITLMAILTGPLAHAADSSRLACDNGNILLHVFEHRTGADSRATEITVIYGGYIFNGDINENENSSTLLKLLGNPKSGNCFKGQISVDYSASKVTVNSGKLILEGQFIDVAPDFTCKELN